MKKIKIICLILIIMASAACNGSYFKPRETPKTVSVVMQTNKGENSQDSSLTYSECIDGIILIKRTIDGTIKYGFADPNKNIIAEPVYDDSKFYISATGANSGFAEGIAPVKKNDKWGYIDKRGKVIIDFIFDDAWCFSEGLAAVCLNGKYGYIDNEGNVTIGCTYSRSYDFHRGVAVAEENNKFGFIDKKGVWLIKPIYSDVDFGRFEYDWAKNDMIRIKYGALWGVVKITNGKAEIIVKPKYTKLYPYRDGKAQFVMIIKDNEGNYTKNGIEGFIDEFGVEIQKREYIVD